MLGPVRYGRDKNRVVMQRIAPHQYDLVCVLAAQAACDWKRMKSRLHYFMCPAGTGLFFVFYFVLAACVAASLLAEFWPPSRRAADGGLLGAAAPPRPPLHSPRTTPLGFPYSTNPLGSQQLSPQDDSIGFPTTTSPRGLHGFCFGSFPPFGRVISLRAAQCHRRLLPLDENWGFQVASDG